MVMFIGGILFKLTSLNFQARSCHVNIPCNVKCVVILKLRSPSDGINNPITMGLFYVALQR